MSNDAMDSKVKGNELFKGKQYQEAVEAYSKAIDANPKFFDCFSNRAACYMHLQQYDKALADADTCITLEPSNTKGYTRKGDALQSLKRYDAAIEAYTTAREKDGEGKTAEKCTAEIERCKEAKSRPRAKPTTTTKGGSLFTEVLFTQFHVLIVVCAIIGALPLGDVSFEAFYWCLKLTLLLNALLLIYAVREQRHFPHFQPDGPGVWPRMKSYFLIIAMSDELQTLTISGLFVASRPFFFGNFPQAVRSVKAVCNVCSRRMPGPIAALASRILRHDLDGLAAWAEVMIAFLLLVELFLPTRNFLVCMMYWHLLRLRYVTETKKPYSPKHTVKAFGAVKIQLDQVFQSRFMPKIVGTVYNKVQSFLANMVDENAQAQQPRCSVM